MNKIKLFAVCIALIPLLVFAQIQRATPKMNVEIYDSSYNFNQLGFTYSTMNAFFALNLATPPFHSASWGAVDLATGQLLMNTTLKDDTTTSFGRSFSIAFNHYDDESATVFAISSDLTGYFLLDDSLNVVLNLYDLGIFPDPHGIAKLQDGRYAYFADTAQILNFQSSTIPDSSDWEAVGHDIVLFDPSDSSTVVLFDWFANIDTGFIIPAYMYEGDLGDSLIDWGHPNSIFEDYDGNLLVSWRHLGCFKIDVNSGNVLWWIGLPDSLGIQNGFNEPTCISGDCITRLQHDIRPIAGMPNHYSLFDNGDTARNYSRALIFEIDPGNNTMTVNKDPHFMLSNFMGSTNVLADGSYLVNVPTIQRLPFDKFPAWMQNGQFQDSILHYIHLAGSDIFLYDANDNLVAKYWTDSANFVYNTFIKDFSSWPMIQCDGDTMEATQSPNGLGWLNASGDTVSTNTRVLADGQDYRLQFPFGLLTGFSTKFNSSSCLSTAITDIRLKDFSAYPNPTNSILQFSEALDKFEIVDLTGKVVLQGQGSFVETASLYAGVYFLHGYIGDSRLSYRFLKD